MLIAKGNQATLEAEICSCDWESFRPQHITDETGHGRHDVRVIRAAPATEAIKAHWPGAAQMFLIERYRHPRTRAMGDTSICTAGPADGRSGTGPQPAGAVHRHGGAYAGYVDAVEVRQPGTAWDQVRARLAQQPQIAAKGLSPRRRRGRFQFPAGHGTILPGKRPGTTAAYTSTGQRRKAPVAADRGTSNAVTGGWGRAAMTSCVTTARMA